MKHSLILYVILTIVTGVLITNCNRNDDDELIEKEQRLLQQYLTDNNITQEPTESGLYYIPVIEGTGSKPTYDSWVEIKYTCKLVDGMIVFTTSDSIAKKYGIYNEDILYGPHRMQLRLTIEGLSEGIQLMNVGETAQFIIPSKLAFGGDSYPGIPKYSTLLYTLELLTAYVNPEAHETMLIRQYLDTIQTDIDSTASGIYYIEEIQGNGELISLGDRVDFWYTGFFLDGRVFDSNIGEEVLSLTIPNNYILPGLNEGLTLMRPSSKGMLLIPYHLAYGEYGSKDPNTGQLTIPPYMTLLIDIEIDSVYLGL